MARVLIWSPNYAPELIGIPPLVTDAAEWLVQRGHRVDVVTLMPNYPERHIRDGYRRRVWLREEIRGVQVYRAWARVRPEERFFDKVLYETTASIVPLPRVVDRLREADVLVCLVPTLLAGAVSSLIARRTRLVLWIQDLVLSVASVVGQPSRAATAALAPAKSLERLSARRADRIVVCSPQFERHFESLGIPAEKVSLVYNWVHLEIDEAPVRNEGPVTFLYAGNLGYSQGFETLIEAARIAGGRVRVNIRGAGNAAARVSRLAGSVDNVAVAPPVAPEVFPSLLQENDVHVVLQKRQVAGANLPSKIATYLASGRPVLGSMDLETSGAALLRESGGAVLVEPESPDALAEAMIRLAGDPTWRQTLGRRSREFATNNLSREVSLPRLERAILG